MPIYNFICNECGEKFEQLCKIRQGTVQCPVCHQTDVAKVVSLISGHSRCVSGSGSCSSKSCSTCKGCN